MRNGFTSPQNVLLLEHSHSPLPADRPAGGTRVIIAEGIDFASFWLSARVSVALTANGKSSIGQPAQSAVPCGTR